MTPAKLAQRRAAKAQRRKAIVRAKRKADLGSRHMLIVSQEGFAPQASMEKASAALMEVADPLLALARDRREVQQALALALVAWNLSLIPANERREAMASFMEELVSKSSEDEPVSREEFLDEFRELMATIISRKLALFPLDRRELAGVEVVDNERNGCFVTVKSLRAVAA